MLPVLRLQELEAMQPKTDKPHKSGGLGLLLIAIVSGLVVKLVGDPLVEVISPQIKHAARDAGELLEDQRWGRQWEKQWERKWERWSDQWQDWRRRQDSP